MECSSDESGSNTTEYSESESGNTLMDVQVLNHFLTFIRWKHGTYLIHLCPVS